MDENLAFAIFALLFGASTLVLRFVAPGSETFGRLEPMKERFGPRLGTALHWGAYTVLPLVVGVVALLEWQHRSDG